MSWIESERESFIADLIVRANAHKGQEPRCWWPARPEPVNPLPATLVPALNKLLHADTTSRQQILAELLVEERLVIERWLNHELDKQYYMQNVHSATQLTAGSLDRSPSGLLHVVGNVSEWTESVFRVPVSGENHSEMGMRVIMGGGWGRNPRHSVWSLDHRAGDFVGNQQISRGFRCAKSADTPNRP